MSIHLQVERLPRPLQRLIDARLDTIDRMLLGRLPRADRLSVTRDVEIQIFELLSQRLGHEPDREDILAVLARLDPPEAYIPEEGGFEATAVLLPSRSPGRSTADPALRKRALVLGILGLVVLAFLLLTPVAYFMALMLESEAIFYAIPLLSTVNMVASLPLLILSIIHRNGGPWAIVGIVAASLSLLISPLGILLLLLMG